MYKVLSLLYSTIFCRKCFVQITILYFVPTNFDSNFVKSLKSSTNANKLFSVKPTKSACFCQSLPLYAHLMMMVIRESSSLGESVGNIHKIRIFSSKVLDNAEGTSLVSNAEVAKAIVFPALKVLFLFVRSIFATYCAELFRWTN